MATANTYRTDLYSLHNYIQNTSIVHPKEIIIEILRDFFSEDSYYHYVKDEWGFPKTPDLTGTDLDAGINDDITTRLFIGEPHRYDVIYYPSLLVRSQGNSAVPLSFSNNRDVVINDVTRFVDGYGNERFVSRPSYFQQAGAWEGSISIDVETRSHRSRDELCELVSLTLYNTRRYELQNAGVHVKNVSIGSPSEDMDRGEKLYKASITCEVRSEWERRIPINNIIDAINICVDIGYIENQPSQIAPNLRVNYRLDVNSDM